MSGIVSLPDLKGVLLAVTNAKSGGEKYLVMSEGARFSEIEVVRINPKQGKVELRVAGSNVVVTLRATTNATPDGFSPIELQEVDLKLVLKLYAECANRSLLLFPTLPVTTLTLRAAPANRVEAAKVFELTLAANNILTIPDGDKFVMVVPKEQAAKATPRSDSIKRPASKPSEAETVIPAGGVNLNGVDGRQVVTMYAEMIGRKPDPDPGAWALPAAWSVPVFFVNQTALTKGDLLYALDTLFEWRSFKLVPVGEDLIKPVPVAPK